MEYAEYAKAPPLGQDSVVKRRSNPWRGGWGFALIDGLLLNKSGCLHAPSSFSGQRSSVTLHLHVMLGERRHVQNVHKLEQNQSNEGLMDVTNSRNLTIISPTVSISAPSRYL